LGAYGIFLNADEKLITENFSVKSQNITQKLVRHTIAGKSSANQWQRPFAAGEPFTLDRTPP